MHTVRNAARDAAEDLFFGQVVIVWARWFVVVAAIIAALWTSDTTSQLTGRILPVVGLMALNLYLHGRYLVERPANVSLLFVASWIDLALITAIIGVWGRGGLSSPYFMLYYPVVFALALVFPPALAAVNGLMCIIAYTAVCLIIDGGIITDSAELKILTMRLIVIAATCGLGAYYWRIVRNHRRGTPAGKAVTEPVRRRMAIKGM
ncbi:MAG TPA: hypothetical protein VFL82_08690 [Thermomicrobiales bacterium]|nr:hypothetical protein [Thermomicrobiales bacterium]